MICTPRISGICAPQRGRPTATSPRRDKVGSAPERSPTQCLPRTPTGQRCASRPRTMLCGIAWRVQREGCRDRFDELRQLCTAAGDKASLAIGMAGLVFDHGFQGRIREASRLASEALALIESIGDATLTVGLSFPVIYAKTHSGEWCDVLRWSQRGIDLADGDPSQGQLHFRVSVSARLYDAGYRPLWSGSSWMARRPAPRRGHGPQRRPVVLRHGCRLRLLPGNTVWRAVAR